MLDKECIQSRGFKNSKSGVETTGFQFDIRLMYYRGLWLSQIRPITVKVDGKEVSIDDILWEIEGKQYTQEEMSTIGNVQWNVLSPATIYVTKLGGLEPGYHDIEADFRFSSSYMPPTMDDVLSYGSHARRILLVA